MCVWLVHCHIVMSGDTIVKSMNQGGEIEKLTVETNISCLVLVPGGLDRLGIVVQ